MNVLPNTSIPPLRVSVEGIFPGLNKKTEPEKGETALPLCDDIAAFIATVHDILTSQEALAEDGAALIGECLESFLEELKGLLKAHPKADETLTHLEMQHPNLIAGWRKGRVWKGDLSELEGSDHSRRCINQVIVKLVEDLGQEAGMSPSLCELLGTVSRHSDLDNAYCVDPTTSTTKLSENAALGLKTSLGNLIWFASFDGSANDQADIQFLPSQIGQYFQEPAEPNRVASGRIAALWLQAYQHLPADKLAELSQNLMKELDGNGRAQARLTVIFEDVRKLEDTLKNISRGVSEPYRDLYLNIFSYQLSLKMRDVALKIESLPLENEERQILASEYFTLSVLRTRFLTGAYYSKGAFMVACQNERGQLNQRKNEDWDSRFTLKGRAEIKQFFTQLQQIAATKSTLNTPLDKFQNELNTLINKEKNPFLSDDLRKIAKDFLAIAASRSLTLPELCRQFAAYSEPKLLVKRSSFPKSTPLDHLEAAIENGLCAHHSDLDHTKTSNEDQLISNAKYVQRFFESAWQFVHLLREQLIDSRKQSMLPSLNNLLTPQQRTSLDLESLLQTHSGELRRSLHETSPVTPIEPEKKEILKLLLPEHEKAFVTDLNPDLKEHYDQLAKLEQSLHERLMQANTLESAKRGKWDKISLAQAIEKIALQEKEDAQKLRQKLTEQKKDILAKKDLLASAEEFAAAIEAFLALPAEIETTQNSLVKPASLNSAAPIKTSAKRKNYWQRLVTSAKKFAAAVKRFFSRSKYKKIPSKSLANPPNPTVNHPTTDPAGVIGLSKADCRKVAAKINAESLGLSLTEQQAKLWKQLLELVDNQLVGVEEQSLKIKALVEKHFEAAKVGSPQFIPMGSDLRMAAFLSDLVNQRIIFGAERANGFWQHSEEAQGIAENLARTGSTLAENSAIKQKHFAKKLIQTTNMTFSQLQEDVLTYMVKLLGLGIKEKVLPLPSKPLDSALCRALNESIHLVE